MRHFDPGRLQASYMALTRISYLFEALTHKGHAGGHAFPDASWAPRKALPSLAVVAMMWAGGGEDGSSRSPPGKVRAQTR